MTIKSSHLRSRLKSIPEVEAPEPHTGTSYELAKEVAATAPHRFVCSSYRRHHDWYEFQTHRWIQVDERVVVNFMINYLKSAILSKIQFYLEGQEHELSSAIAVKYAQQEEQLLRKVTDFQFKKKIVSELAIIYYDEQFSSKLDANKYLLGFNNGVYDFMNLEFRPGQPEDYLSLTVGYDYDPILFPVYQAMPREWYQERFPELVMDKIETYRRAATLVELEDFQVPAKTSLADHNLPDNVYDILDSYHKANAVMVEIVQFMKDLFPDDDLRAYIWWTLTQLLVGGPNDQAINLFYGTGANGKTTFIQLIQTILGDYAGGLSSSVLASRRPSSAATPELARLKGTKIVTLQELSNHEGLNFSTMKELTGGDMILCRPLYREPMEFKPTFKLFASCHEILELNPDDSGTWRRLRVIPFCTHFTHNPTRTADRQIDHNILKRMVSWRETLMAYLIYRYRFYHLEGYYNYNKTSSNIPYDSNDPLPQAISTATRIWYQNRADAVNVIQRRHRPRNQVRYLISNP